MSKTVVIEISNNSFPALTVPPNTFVVWHNRDPYAHSAETLPSDPHYFNAGAMLPNEKSSPILFVTPGAHRYICRYHTGMTGTVTVVEESAGQPSDDSHSHDHGQHGLHHLHGFVTGGWSGDRIYMTHTPVLADSRHNYQVILRGRFVKPQHAKIYEWLRASPYGDRVVQVFHDHISLPEIGGGKITLLPNASVAHWPGGTQTTIGFEQLDVPGLEDVPIAIDEVIHFHQFDTEADYPEALTYVLYGDQDDVFIDHLINRAPSFHSVAKLAAPPKGWNAKPVTFTVPGRAIRELEPRQVSRLAMVDNAYHVFWLLPPGSVVRQAQDPLIRRNNPAGANHTHPIVFAQGQHSEIAISRFLHFDIRLLNYGVLIV